MLIGQHTQKTSAPQLFAAGPVNKTVKAWRLNGQE